MAFGNLDPATFIGPGGKVMRRPRVTVPGKVDVPDLDAMNLEQCQALMEKARGMPKPRLYQSMFPTRPLGFANVARLMITMLYQREAFLRTGVTKYRDAFESCYKRLPRWAQWRYKYNVLAAVPEGGKLRKRPRK